MHWTQGCGRPIDRRKIASDLLVRAEDHCRPFHIVANRPGGQSFAAVPLVSGVLLRQSSSEFVVLALLKDVIPQAEHL